MEIQLPGFCINLRKLCESHRSISEVCRKIPINRQQFNKYLCGQHRPSGKNLRAICEFFGIQEDDLFLSVADFETRVNTESIKRSMQWIDNKNFLKFANKITENNINIKSYYGVYDRYHYSSIHAGKILRSTVCISGDSTITKHVCYENFPRVDQPFKSDYSFKYCGYTAYLDGHIIMMDFEVDQENEVTFTHLTPINRNPKKYLFGLLTGVSATMHREAFSTKVAFMYRKPLPLIKEDILRATTLNPDDSSIPIEILSYLSDGPNTIRAK